MNVKNPMTWLNEQISTTLLPTYQPILSIYYSIPHTGLKLCPKQNIRLFIYLLLLSSPIEKFEKNFVLPTKKTIYFLILHVNSCSLIIPHIILSTYNFMMSTFLSNFHSRRQTTKKKAREKKVLPKKKDYYVVE